MNHHALDASYAIRIYLSEPYLLQSIFVMRT